MLVNKVKLLIFISSLFLKSQGLEKIDSKEDIILVTESVIRNTTNNLFLRLNLNKQENHKIKQALLVHNFFTSVTLKDHNTLNLIVKLSRVNKYKANNETERFIVILNEILNEDWDGADVDSLADNESILEYIDEFLNNLNGFKENSGYNDNHEKLDIKDEIIHILKSDNPSQFNPLLKQNLTLTKHEKDTDFLSDNEFWVPQPTRRIFQGQRTKIKHFPFMASIHIFKNFQCAGSIIKSDLILTAASCLQLAWNNRFFRENPAFLSVIVGSNFYNGGGEGIPVLEVYFHHDYNPKNLRNNIAVLRLLRHLKFRKHKRRLKKIEIDRHESPLPMTTDGITIVGWGAKGASNIVRDPWSNQLAFAVLDVYHLQECQEIYSREYVTRTNFCAGFTSKGGGACNHDVGGPGVVNGVLAGIISFGSPVCGTPDAPTVFTKVGYYAEWIEEIMDQDVPSSYRKTTVTYPTPMPTPPKDLKTTSFKILPITDWKPLPLYEEDALRLLEDENLFKEFLSTMFNSKEVDEYKDLLSDVPVKKSIANGKEPMQKVINNKIRKPDKYKPNTNIGKFDKFAKEHIGSVAVGKLQNVINNKREKDEKKKDMYKNIHEQSSPEDDDGLHELATDAGYHTEIGMFDSDKQKQKRYTVFDINTGDEEKEKEEAFEKDIVQLIDNIDISDTIEQSGVSEASEETGQGEAIRGHVIKDQKDNIAIKEVAVTQLDMNLVTEKPHKKPTKQKMKKDEVLTLLYISDTDSNEGLRNIENDIQDFDDNLSEGIPISADGFKDLTFRNNITKPKSLLDFISRSELYDMLSEAIDEVTNYKKT